MIRSGGATVLHDMQVNTTMLLRALFTLGSSSSPSVCLTVSLRYTVLHYCTRPSLNLLKDCSDVHTMNRGGILLIKHAHTT